MPSHNTLLVPTGTHKHRPEHRARWRGWVAAVIVLGVLSFSGWVVYTRLIAPPVPIEQRPIKTNALVVAPRDTVVSQPVPPERVAAIRKMANCRRADVDARVRALADSFPRWPNWILASAACGAIRSSMTREQLRATLGEPTRIVPSTAPYRPIETWYYGNKLSVILWDGLVKSWQ
jgi:hypothetical protein